jgi:hypothetical protein
MPAANQSNLECFKLAAGMVGVVLFLGLVVNAAIEKRDMCRDRRTTEVYSSASMNSVLGRAPFLRSPDSPSLTLDRHRFA